MNNKNITIITTWDNEEFILDVHIEKWFQTKQQIKTEWGNSIFLEKYQYELYFWNIKSTKWKTQYFSLPETKEETPFFLLWSNEKQKILKENPQLYYKLKKEEEEWRKKRAEWLRKIWWVTLEKRKKSFLEKREEILKRLAFEEKELWFKTTISKLEEL